MTWQRMSAANRAFPFFRSDAIILSTVDNQIGEFADDPHLLNVAISRAKEQFVLVTSAQEQPDSNIQDLIRYIEYWSGGREESRLRSIFDLLYSSNTEERLAFLSRHRRVSEYDSENIMYGFLEDLFTRKGMANYCVLLQYPLGRLVVPRALCRTRSGRLQRVPGLILIF